MKLVYLVLSLLLATAASAQEWVELREAGAPFSEVQAAFYEEFAGREDLRGRGHKPFHRWEYFTEQRVYPGEFLPPTSHIMREFYEHGLDRQPRNSSNRDEGDWQPVGMTGWTSTSGWNPGIGRISAIDRHPFNSQILFVGTPSGGLWKSTNGGQDWTSLTDHLPTPGVSGIAINQQNPEIMYIGTGDGDGNDSYSIGVLKSTDGGETWATTSLSYSVEESIRCNRLLIHPTNGDILYAATSNGLYKTDNAGLTWSKKRNGNIRDVVFQPGNTDVVFCSSNRFYKSTDSGENFDLISEGTPGSSEVTRIAMAVTQDDPERVYLLAANNTDSGLLGVYRSDDAGETFTLTFDELNILGYPHDGSGEGGQGWYDLDIAVSPTDADRVYTGGINMWESTNGGFDFEAKTFWIYGDFPVQTYVHADIHRLEFIGSEFYCGSDGGIFRSSDFGNTFTDLSAGLQHSQFYRIDVANYNSGRIIGGTQDNGTNLRENGEWIHVIGADGMDTHFHPTDPDIMFGSSQYGGLRKSINGGASFYGITDDIEEDGAWVTPFLINPVNPTIMYAGFENVWRSLNGGENWLPISDFGNSTLRHLEICASNPNHIFAADYNIIRKTTNGGNDWEIISSGLPNLSFTRVVCNPQDPQHLWVTLSGYSDGEKIYETTDGGESWQNVSGNLPNVPANCVAFNPATGGLYLGTDLGMFYTNDDLANWQPFNNGLPNTIIEDIEIHTGDDNITVGTYGRGIWQSGLFVPSSEVPVPGFTASNQKLCAGQSITFSDISMDNEPSWSWEFEGGMPATSDEHSPAVTYPEPGIYDVTLTVQNGNGTNSLTLEDFITVYEENGVNADFEEGFEEMETLAESEWHSQSTGVHTGWTVTNLTGYSGEKSLTVQNYELDIAQTHEFISEPKDLSSSGSALLSYYFSYSQMTEDDQDRLYLYISSDCGATWSLKKIYSAQSNLLTSEAEQLLESFIPSGSSEWSYDEYEIPENYLTGGFMFKFLFENDNGNNLYLDDINLSSTVGFKELASEVGVDIYPNPASDQLQVSISHSTVQPVTMKVFDMNGKQMNIIQLPGFGGEQTVRIPVSTWASGIYNVTIASGRESRTVKFVKQ